MKDKDSKLLEEAYLSSFINQPTSTTLYDELESISNLLMQGKISKRKLIDKFNSLKDELTEISAQLRVEDMVDLANRLAD